jgi:hypothetical protein
MVHNTTVGPVLDENDKPVPGLSFHVKGVLESSHAGELMSQDQFDALVIDDVELTRTAGGGFEYSIEFVVSQEKFDAIQAAKPKPAAPAPVVSDVDRAVAYFKSKGHSEGDSKVLVARFGAARVLEAANAEADQELDSLLHPKAPELPPPPPANAE